MSPAKWTATEAEITTVILTALMEVSVREIKANDSPRIREFQKVTGNAPPDSWCMSFVQWGLLQVFGKKRFPPLPKSGSCQAVRLAAKKLGWIKNTPKGGAIGLLIDTKRDHAHHTFLVTGPTTNEKKFPTVEGNTNPNGGREGYGVFPRARRIGGTLTYEFIHLPTKEKQ
jgi:hypothetical protein